MSQSYCNLLYHLVFSTKNRQDWLRGESSARTHEYLGGAIRGEGGVAIMVGGTSNHVHILAKLRQDRSVSDILRNDQIQLVGVDSPGVPEFRSIRLAGRLRGIHRQPVTGGEGVPLHSGSRGTSQEGVIRGGVCRVAESARNRIRGEVPVALNGGPRVPSPPLGAWASAIRQPRARYASPWALFRRPRWGLSRIPAPPVGGLGGPPTDWR